MSSNYPPGVTDNMIPGNRPEDAAYEVWCETFGAVWGGGTADLDVAHAILERSGAATDAELEAVTLWDAHLASALHSSTPAAPERHTDRERALLALWRGLVAALRALDGADLAELAVNVDLAPPFDVWLGRVADEVDD